MTGKYEMCANWSFFQVSGFISKSRIDFEIVCAAAMSASETLRWRRYAITVFMVRSYIPGRLWLVHSWRSKTWHICCNATWHGSSRWSAAQVVNKAFRASWTVLDLDVLYHIHIEYFMIKRTSVFYLEPTLQVASDSHRDKLQFRTVDNILKNCDKVDWNGCIARQHCLGRICSIHFVGCCPGIQGIWSWSH